MQLPQRRSHSFRIRCLGGIWCQALGELEADDVADLTVYHGDLGDPLSTDQQRAANPGIEVCERGGDVESSIELVAIDRRRVQHLRDGNGAVATDHPEHTTLVPSTKLLNLVGSKNFDDPLGEIHGDEPLMQV